MSHVYKITLAIEIKNTKIDATICEWIKFLKTWTTEKKPKKTYFPAVAM